MVTATKNQTTTTAKGVKLYLPTWSVTFNVLTKFQYSWLPDVLRLKGSVRRVAHHVCIFSRST